MQSEIKNTNDKNFSLFEGSPEGRQYIPLSEAGKILNTSRDYMNVLVRRGKLRAVKLGRNWVTTKEWVAEYRTKGTPVFASDMEGKQDFKKEEEKEFKNLKSNLILEREKALEIKALIPEIALSSRELKAQEKNQILEAVKKQFKIIDVSEFQKASRHLGVLKSLRWWSGGKFIAASAVAVFLLAIFLNLAIGGFDVSKSFKVSKFQSFNISKYQASIFSDVFKNFPNDIPFFYRWFTLSLSKGLTFLKSKSPSELVVGELPKGESKIVKPQETASRIDTLDDALALDSLSPGEEGPQFAESEEIPLSGLSSNQFTLIENRLSVVEASLVEQKTLTQAELSLQKKTILGTLETLIGISKLLPSYPISTIVVQGQPATLTSYSISPSVHSGFDRLSANYFNLANNAEINGSLTVKSGGTFNTLSVSGATSLSGNTTIGGTLNVSGETTLNNLIVNGTFNLAGSSSLGNASSTNLTVSNKAWINQLIITGTATTTFNNPITSASGNFIVAGDSASNVLLNPYGGNVGIGTTSPGSLLSVHSSGNVYIGGNLTVSGTTNLSGSSFSSTNASYKRFYHLCHSAYFLVNQRNHHQRFHNISYRFKRGLVSKFRYLEFIGKRRNWNNNSFIKIRC
ncbi:MAG: hypothetical protein HYV51_01270 [Parcubacteria group bacterium]|nr:hypothetical protein [Parcubacteria group bacterium]